VVWHFLIKLKSFTFKLNTMHVLVVEDEPRVADLVKRALEHDQHRVDLAADGTDGLAMAAEGTFDAVVLDILLPGINGIEVCRRLRSAKVHTPVLMLTARDAVEQRVEGLDAGADDYLTKPFAIAELQARVRALGRRRAEVENEILQTGRLTMDRARHEVRMGASLINLGPKEFMLLELMLRNKGRILSRQQILDSVWGYDYATESNIVDLYVHYLRSKVDKPHGEKLIRTVRGVGYGIEDI
jgi:DNA-binding response OmpR family regulator